VYRQQEWPVQGVICSTTVCCMRSVANSQCCPCPVHCSLPSPNHPPPPPPPPTLLPHVRSCRTLPTSTPVHTPCPRKHPSQPSPPLPPPPPSPGCALLPVRAAVCWASTRTP
jgi:hypothetical protein